MKLHARIYAAWSCLKGRPTIFNVMASVACDEFEMIAMLERGGIHQVAGQLHLDVPNGTLVEGPDGQLWVAGEDVVHFENGHSWVETEEEEWI